MFSRGSPILQGDEIRPNVQPLKQYIIGDIGKVLWVLMGGIGLVLVIACANVAVFFWSELKGDTGVGDSSGFGRSRGRIAGGLLLESLILAAFGGGLGLLLLMAACGS